MKEMIYGSRKDPGTGEILHYESSGIFGIAIISYGSHPCAYIKVPEALIDKVEERTGVKRSEGGFYDYVDGWPHGGFTYYGDAPISDLPDGRYLGWDYAHYGDYTYTDMPELGLVFNHDDEKKWTTEEIYKEAVETLKEIRTSYGFY